MRAWTTLIMIGPGAWRAACLAVALLIGAQGPLRAAPAIDSGALLARLYGPDQAARLWQDPEQARQALALLRDARVHGLDPAYYQIDALAQELAQGSPAADRALSKAMLQFLTDLQFGRLQPDFQLPPLPERLAQFDPAAHLRLALQQGRLRQAVDAATPRMPLYRRVQATLQQYRALAADEQAWRPPSALPASGKLVAGAAYPGLDALRARLQLLGDLDAAPGPPEADRHDAALNAALKRFQGRHGLAETGNLGRETLAALAVPLAHRVRQLELTLERLRWMPPLAPGRLIVVNVASYRLLAFDTARRDGGEPLEMRVIVGKAARTPTPLFIGQMRYLEFNPYWNVPPSIATGEIIPKLRHDPDYLRKNGMELVSPAGVAAGLEPADAVAGLRSGKLRVRQTPGAHNVLGAVKFAMPNPMHIYLHSTSAKELFARTRRDLSHGCIRIEQPALLAAFVLSDQPQWSVKAIEAAMAPGPARTVRLNQPIPVVLFYATAMADRRGRAVFANDIYRRDAALIRALQAS